MTTKSRSARANQGPVPPEPAAPAFPGAEPIAIIGIGCRFPGADGPDAFWRLLREGVDAVTEVPKDRWNVEDFYDPTPGKRGRMITRWGGFLQNVDRFDSQFFGISPREAMRMDPQQRLLLEVAWEALEDAGQVLERLAGSHTGVFIGISGNDYGRMQMFPRLSDAYMGTGNANSIVANRISYVANLRGPSLTVDTACSSSLVALHLACSSLWRGESALALAGGVSVILSPTITINFSLAGMLSPDGRCKAFDAAANGYVRGEGAGVVVLKPLSRALSDGDPVHALIRGSAVNQDGHSQGLTVPSAEAQEAVLLAACSAAGVLPGELDYVEAHGTGTAVGDPIEANALGRVLRTGRGSRGPCAVGSVKTNVGHLEAASGIAGLIKVALALENRAIPPSLHFHVPNPQIPFDEIPLRVQTTLGAWPRETSVALAGVNSFGFGGTNAHLVLAGHDEQTLPGNADRPPYVLPLSARSPEALRDLAEAHRDFLRKPPVAEAGPSFLADVCYTAGVRRSHHDHRASFVLGDREELIESLDAFLRGEEHSGIERGTKETSPPKLVFVFPGQGAQWWAMGRSLLESEAAFRECVEECDRALRQLAGWSLLEALTAEESRSRLADTEVAQPALFAIQLALAALWKSWGVTPDAVVGHSVGEVAAACVAGSHSLADAMRVIFHRARLMQRATGLGKMAAVELSWEDAGRALSGYEGQVAIAAHNSPTSTTLAGEPRALEEILERLQRQGTFVRVLPVNYAFHSAQMDPFLEELVESLEGIESRATSLPYLSTVTGSRLDGLELDARYWARNVREPVRFSTAIEGAIEAGHHLFVELSPHPTLFGPIARCLQHRAKTGATLASLRRGEDDKRVMLSTAAALHARGYPIDWSRQYSGRRRVARLPRYPWQRERHWLEIDETSVGGAWIGPASGDRHPLLGRSLESAIPTWEVELDGSLPPYLADHRIQSSVLLPAAAYVEMALAASASLGPERRVLSELVFHQAMILAERSPRRVQATLSPLAPGETSFRVYSRPREGGGSWIHHASARLRPEPLSAGMSVGASPSLAEVRARCSEEVSVEELYSELRRRGLEYGPSFRGLVELFRGAGEALGRLELPSPLAGEVSLYHVHPALLDACLHGIAAAAPDDAANVGAGDVYLPIGIDRVHTYGRPGRALWSHARLRQSGPRDSLSLEADVRIFGDAGELLIEVSGLRLQRLDRSASAGAEDPSDWLCRLVWERKARPGRESFRLAPDYMPGSISIAERLEPPTSQANSRAALSRYAEIDALGPIYILNAFRESGWDPRREERVSSETLAARMGVAPRHGRFLERLLERLHEERILRRVGSEWEVSRVPAPVEPEDTRQALLSAHPAFEAELTLVGRCGRRLGEVLRGEVDPLQLLFPEGSVESSESLYQDSPFVRVYNELVRDSIQKALERLPEDRTVRILEVGGGTGGTTHHVLPGLPSNRTDYFFTDVSRLFLLHAERKFRAYPFVRARLLDIERDPGEQGFELQSFDVILAAHVLHATSDLRATLRRVRSLLKPGGLLVLLEGTGLHILYDLVFAMTEGWWKFQDLDLRPSHPLLSPQKWCGALEAAGFEDPVAVPGSEDGDPSRQAVILAHASRSERKDSGSVFATVPPAAQGCWVVLSDGRGTAESLCALLRSRGERTLSVVPGDGFEREEPGRYRVNPTRAADFHRLIAEARSSPDPVRGVVHFWSLDQTTSEDVSSTELEAAQATVCGSVLHLVRALAGAEWTDVPPRLWLVTKGAQAVKDEESVSVIQAPLWGLARVIAGEQPGLQCTMVDLSARAGGEEILALDYELREAERDDQIALRGELCYVRRLVRAGEAKAAATRRAEPGDLYRLEIKKPGMLDSLTLRAATRREPGPGEVEIQVLAAGLNFRDVMKAMGVYPAGPDELQWLGDECSGRIVAVGEGVRGLQIGDEVIAASPASFASFATTPAALVVAKPAHLSFEEAATIPVAFLTAYYALYDRAGLRKGERVLIHAAAGGVGLAAVQLARFAGAEIFATAGSPEKRAFLQSSGVEHVFDSRSLAFADEVMERTGGEGVDVVLNSLAGEAIEKSLSVLRANGRFLEIGKRDIYQNTRLGLSYLRNNLSFFAIDLGALFSRKPEFCGSLLRELSRELGTLSLKPLPFRVFPLSQAESAFRHMAQAAHIGKIVLSLEEPERWVEGPSDGVPRFRPDGTFLITGGFGGFGLAIARWMVEHGARHLVLVGREGARGAVARDAVEDLRRSGAEVAAVAADVSNPDELAKVLLDVEESMPPLRGVVHAAMVLDDVSVLELTPERLKAAMAPKMTGAWNLHRLTSAAKLDFFVLFSSAASLIGSPGQGNYVAGNAFLEALAHYRRARGLPAMTVQWGRLNEVGYVARHPEVSERLERLGLKGFSPREALSMLGRLLQENPIEIGVVRTDWKEWRKFHSGASLLLSHFTDEARADSGGDGKGTLREALLSAAPGERRPLVESYLRRELGRVLRLDPSRVDSQKPLNTFGLDSLMGIELTTRIETDLGVGFPMASLSQGSSLFQLSEQLLSLVLDSAAPEPAADPSARVERMSDEEVDSLLGEILADEDPGGGRGSG